MEYVAAALKNVSDNCQNIKHGLKIIFEAPIMRHFTVEFEKIEIL
jgi:tryptophanase